MKSLAVVFSVLLLNILISCSNEQPDCVCSAEFRMYLVTVIDTLGNPVDSLQTKVTNSWGKVYTFEELSQPPYLDGAYFVMTDGYQYDFTTRPEKILFRGNKNSLEVIAEFFFNTDECRCHVHKVSGPDTLVLK